MDYLKENYNLLKSKLNIVKRVLQGIYAILKRLYLRNKPTVDKVAAKIKARKLKEEKAEMEKENKKKSIKPRHYFHLVERDELPFLLSMSMFVFILSLVYYISFMRYSGIILILSIILVLSILCQWFLRLNDESNVLGVQTRVVRFGIKLGFLLFITSEVMLFFSFFWAYFHFYLGPDFYTGNVIWPPLGINALDPKGLPLLNTYLLLLSGAFLTWSHKSLMARKYKNSFNILIITIILGVYFLINQMYEYYYAAFDLSDGVYGSIFFMLTGLHGLHVFLGVSFLLVCLFKIKFAHYRYDNHDSFTYAIWYWHFVDVVWIFVFLFIYRPI